MENKNKNEHVEADSSFDLLNVVENCFGWCRANSGWIKSFSALLIGVYLISLSMAIMMQVAMFALGSGLCLYAVYSLRLLPLRSILEWVARRFER